MSLLGRQVILQIGTPDDTGREYKGFRVNFIVEMDRTSAPNQAKIELYNMNAESVALAQASDSIARLLCGYDLPLQVFRGNPVKNGVHLEKRGTDRVLLIEAQDGQRELVNGFTNISFATDTTLQQVIDEIVASCDLAEGTIRIEEDISFSQGVVLSGQVSDLLDQIAISSGAEWYIRDGSLQFVPRDESTGESAVVFSSATGNLIGIPIQKDGGVEIRGLLSPQMRPGKPFRVESETITGDYLADKVVFRGDSGWETDFYVDIRGIPL